MAVLGGVTELELVRVPEIGFRVDQRLHTLLELFMVLERLSPQDVYEVFILLILVLVLLLPPEKFLVMLFLFDMGIVMLIKTVVMLMRGVFLCFLPDEVDFDKEA